VLDQHAVPSTEEFEGWIVAARRAGYRRLRTSALFPSAANTALSSGFVAVDTLALLRADLAVDDAVDDAPRIQRPRRRRSLPTRPLRSRHLTDAARLDQEAFGIEWGNDPTSLREIRRATPVHRARCVVRDGAVVGFAISGAGGSTGYLQRLAVDTVHRRTGVASALVADSLRWMRRNGLRNALVNTGVANEAALGLYAGFGFHRLADRLVVAEFVLEPDRPDCS
jgi:ribosomal protein S18 acetylase RimI-like enzyme